ncbi:hypothetical protein EIK79_04200 [Halocatena pleomorpha]|uniref:Uncharacterized protein n=1 Tax=Halocatena pleomorpha TaxID=1785090 RepID=A0A3P3RGL3_9EURY|nr:hypothetical protein EIK79_04200 [Halocatena pleomorpha]
MLIQCNECGSKNTVITEDREFIRCLECGNTEG